MAEVSIALVLTPALLPGKRGNAVQRGCDAATRMVSSFGPSVTASKSRGQFAARDDAADNLALRLRTCDAVASTDETPERKS